MKKIIETFKRNNIPLYYVGGYCRSVLLGIEHTGDIDFATPAMPEKVLEILGNNGIPSRFVGEAFGVTLATVGSVSYEIATFRGEADYIDGRHPETVELGVTLEEDLGRRDFTVNAIAINCITGEVIDPFGGADDLQTNVLRTVFSPRDRFEEDYLRILRAFRFWGMGFVPTQDLLYEIARDPTRVNKIAKERVREELLKIFKRSRQDLLSTVVKAMLTTGVLQQILPEVARLSLVLQTKNHYDSVFDHTLEVMEYSKLLGGDELDLLAVLLHDIGKWSVIQKHPDEDKIIFYGHAKEGASIAKTLMMRLCFSRKDISLVSWLVRYHMSLHSLEGRVLRRFMKRRLLQIPVEWMQRLVLLTMADSLAKFKGAVLLHLWSVLDEVVEEMKPLKKLAITGYDIMQQLHIPSSRLIGQLKRQLHDAVLVGKVSNERLALLEYLREVYDE